MKKIYLINIFVICVVIQSIGQTIERIEPGVYTLYIKHSNKTLDNAGYPSTTNKDVYQWGSNGLDFQKWKIDSVGGGYYKLVCLSGGLAVDVNDCGTEDGADIRQWDWLDNDCQKWRFEKLDDGFYRVVNKNSGKVMDVKYSETQDGANVWQWGWLGGDCQRWRLEKKPSLTIAPGIYRIAVKHSNNYLDNTAYTGSGEYGNVVQWGRNFSNFQNWRIDPVGNGFYKITSIVSNKVLESTDCGNNNGSLVRQASWLNKDCQKWSFEELGDGFLMIVNKLSGKVIEVNAGGINSDAAIQMYDWNSKDWQRWRLEKVMTPVNDFVYEHRSTKKINQLVGDWDFQRNQPTLSRSYERYRLPNTDLGVPFAHNGQTYLLFGDQFHTTYYQQRGAQDPIGIMSNNTNLDWGAKLDFVKYLDGRYREIVVSGVNMGPFGVGVEGVSWNNNMYIYVSNSGSDGNGGTTMTFSALAKSTNNGYSFTRLYNMPASKFINVSVVKTKSDINYPEPIGSDIQVMVGSGPYRRSQIFLAYQRGDQIENLNSIRYFMGVSGDGKPRWSPRVEDAIPLFEQGNVGELSLSYNNFIKKWILTYYGTTFRLADNPWGAWSDDMSLFDAWEDGGYCHFMYYPDCTEGENPDDNTTIPQNGPGGPYGPYQFEDFARGDTDHTTVFWTLSTWNPYTSLLMKSNIVRKKTLNTPIEAGVYMFFINKSGELMMDNGGNGGADVIQWGRNDMVFQRWRIDPVEPGYYKITSVQSGEVIQPKDNSYENGASISQESWINADIQKWYFNPIQGGQFYEIRNKATNKVLEMHADKAKQWDANGANWQQWRIEKCDLKAGVYKIVAKHSYQVLDNHGFNGTGDRNLVQYTWHGGNAQKWLIEPTNDGYYKFTSLLSGEVMDLTNCKNENGADIGQWQWLNNDCQKWSISPVSGGYMKIINKSSGKVVEIDGAHNLAQIQTWDWNTRDFEQDWQLWRFDYLSESPLNTRDANISFTEEELILQTQTNYVKIYPNPVEDALNIEFLSPESDLATIEIYDPLGRKIVSEQFNTIKGLNYKQLNASHWHKGLHLVRIKLSGSNIITDKKISK